MNNTKVKPNGVKKHANKIVFLIVVLILLLIIAVVIWHEVKYDELFADPEPTSKTIFGDNIQIIKLPQVQAIESDKHALNFSTKTLENYRSFNPSITRIDNEILYAFRLSNATNCTHKTKEFDGTYDNDIKNDNVNNEKFLTKGNGHISSFITLAKAPIEDLNKMIEYQSQFKIPKTKFQRFMNTVRYYTSVTKKPIPSIENITTLDILVENISNEGCAKGMEDARIIISPDRKKLHIFANSLSGPDCRNEMWLMNINMKDLNNTNNNSNDSITVTPIKLKIDFDLDRKQKNWMPFFYNNNLMLIYNVNPHVILECDIHTGTCIKMYQTFNENLPKNIRGGSCAIRINTFGHSNISTSSVFDFYVTATHVQRASHRYVTQFYAFETKPPFKIVGVSDDFVFDETNDNTKPSIQFASGLERIDDKIIVTFGEDDCSSKACQIPLANFLNALNPIKPKIEL